MTLECDNIAPLTHCDDGRVATEACRIDALEIDGRPIAMGVTIKSGRNAALWKIAYDESLSPYSLGVQFILEYARHQLADDSVDATDSCAIPDHPMIDQLWRERIAIADFFVASDASSATAFGAAVEREALRRGVRAIAKREIGRAHV